MKIEIVSEGKKILVGLDKITIGLEYPKMPKTDKQDSITPELIAHVKTKQAAFISNMKHIEAMIKLGPHKVSNTKNKDLKRYKVFSEIDGGLLCIFSLGFSFGTGVINFEINPSRLTKEKWDELLDLLSILFNDHYEELYTNGVVSHAEFYVDIPDEDLPNLVLVDLGRRAYTLFKGTTYLGRRKSHSSVAMYDKAKEQKQNGKLVRIEIRFNDRGIRFQVFVENDLFNPFSNILVVDVNQLNLVANEWKNPQLANHIIELGLYEAVKNKNAREAILAKLKENAVTWWKPDLFWAAHRELLLRFKPGQAGGVAPQTPPPLLEIATL